MTEAGIHLGFSEMLDRFRRLTGAADDTGEHQTSSLALELLTLAVELTVSDIHFDSVADGIALRVRLDGVMHEVGVLEPRRGRRLLNHFKALAGLDPSTVFHAAEKRSALALPGGEVEVRLTLLPTIMGPKMALRLFDPERFLRRIPDLGLVPSEFERLSRWLDQVDGLVLCVGPTGSGKTTTLYALMHALAERNRHVVAIEDPAECHVPGTSQVQIDPQHDFAVADALKAAIRLDPDCLVLGEIRDGATAREAMRIAAAGRAVLATMHAGDAAAACTRLRLWGLRDEEIATSVVTVLAQRLVRRACPDCRHPGPADHNLREWLDSLGLADHDPGWTTVGCSTCRQIGYVGRTGLFEAWLLDHDDADAVRRGLDEHRLRQFLHEHEHRFMLDDGLAKVREGVTTLDEVRRVCAFLRPGHPVRRSR